MNVLAVLILLSALFVASAPNEPMALDSLCIFSDSKCKRSEKYEPKSPKEVEGFYCLSGPDFKKVVNKLQSIQDLD